jgi:hypothetical protein
MGHRAANETMPVGLEERREKPVHALKSRETKERVTLERLQAAGGIRTIITKECLTQAVSKFGGESPSSPLTKSGLVDSV